MKIREFIDSEQKQLKVDSKQSERGKIVQANLSDTLS